MLKHKFRVNKITRIKQRGGEEPGDEARVGHSPSFLSYTLACTMMPHWGVFLLPQPLYCTMQLGCIFMHPRVYEISRVHKICTSCFFL